MSLVFQTDPFSLISAIVVVALAVFIAVISWENQGSSPRFLLLETLRFLILLLMAFLLLSPEWIVQLPTVERTEIPVLVDTSASMQTRDIVLSSGQTITRLSVARQSAQHLLSANPQLSLIEFANPQSFNDQRDACTDLARSIEEYLSNPDKIRAIVMISDGCHNGTGQPLVAAQKLREAGIPFIAIPVGSERPLPDIRLTRVVPPEFGVVSELVQILYTLENTMLNAADLTLKLTSLDSGKTVESRITLGPGERHEGMLPWKVTKNGPENLRLEVSSIPGESDWGNNSTDIVLNGRQETIKCLVVDSLPRWEYRFIRNALSRDPAVEVHTLLFLPGMSRVGHGNNYLERFPESMHELASYDVIFLGDIGLGDRGLTLKQAELIKGLIEQRAVGLILMPGPLGKQMDLLQSPLKDLMPVLLDTSHPQGVRQTVPSALVLTPEGKRSLLTQLVDEPTSNESIWKELPGFYWYAPVLRAKAGAQVLAVHESATNSSGRLPLLVAQPAGAGKVLFMGTDAVWRWRRGVEDKYHYRFWRQVARWMSYRRHMAANSRLHLISSPEHPNVGDTIRLTVLASDTSGSPYTDGTVLADITNPNKTVHRIQFKPIDHTWGTYQAQLTLTTPGAWTIKAFCADAPESPQTIVVETSNQSREIPDEPANPTLMQDMASITGGIVLSPDQVANASIDNILRQIPPPSQRLRSISLVSHPVTVVTLLTLISLFWILKKRQTI